MLTHASKSVTYARREFVQQLTTPPPDSGDPDSYTGNLAVLALNPGIDTTFPWLSSVCSFEQYRFKHLRFSFQSSLPTSAPGQVVMVTNVDAKDPIMHTDREILSYSGAATGRAWDSHSHSVPKQAMVSKNFVRISAVPENADRSLYDVGVFYVRCLGVPKGSVVGTLWVDYEIEFFNPKVLVMSLARTLRILGDRKTVTQEEPFGADDLLVEAGQSGVRWSCPPISEKPGFCQLKIWPDGLTNIQATAYTGYASSEGFPQKPLFEFVDGQLGSLRDYATGLLEDVENASVVGNSGFASILASITDPTQAIDLFYRLAGTTVASATDMIQPNMVVNLWK